MTLREQVEEIAVRRVNAPWFKAAGIVRAVNNLLTKAYVEDWPRDSMDARVLLRFEEMIRLQGLVTENHPGIEGDRSDR